MAKSRGVKKEGQLNRAVWENLGAAHETMRRVLSLLDDAANHPGEQPALIEETRVLLADELGEPYDIRSNRYTHGR